MLLPCLFILLAFGSIVNERVVRVIDLTSQVEKQIVKTEISNSGIDPVRSYYFPIPLTKRSKLSFFKAVDKNSNEMPSKIVQRCPVSMDATVESNLGDYFYLEIELSETLKRKDVKFEITLTLIYVHVLQMLPAKIKQKDNQYVVYEGNRYCDSVYFTKKQHTKINVASETMKSYTKDSVEVTGKKLKYGTYEDIGPLISKSLRVHFRNNNAFLTMDNVVRDFELSHWGNVRVSEFYNIRHDGAKLVGPYESQDAMSQFYGGKLAEPSAVRELKATLPAGATRVTYSDRIGNISTSNFHSGKKKSTLRLDLRYKLLGGWKTDFKISYDVPANEFISVENDDATLHHFDASFGIPFSKPVANYVKTSVALPEGAYDVKVNLPFDVDDLDYDVRYTYLDSTLFGGRPVVYFVKTNVVREHFEKFSISYRYSRFRIYYKIILAASLAFAFFMVFVLIGRLDMSLKDHSTSGFFVQEAIKSILELDDGNDEAEVWTRVENLQRVMNRMDDMPPEICKRMDRLMKLRNVTGKKRKSGNDILNKAKQLSQYVMERFENFTGKEKSL